jgi:hypothetical protein
MAKVVGRPCSRTQSVSQFTSKSLTRHAPACAPSPITNSDLRRWHDPCFVLVIGNGRDDGLASPPVKGQDHAPRLVIAALISIVSIGSAHAVQLSIGGCAGAPAGYGTTTCMAAASVVDFNAGPALPADFSGSGAVFHGTTGTWATPGGDTSNYLAVATTSPSGSEDIRLHSVNNYFGLLCGSIDRYNEVQAYLNGVLVGTVDGADVIAANTAFGDQHAAGSNEYVNMTFGTGFDEIRLVTSNYNFEVDNLAFAQVPEPSALGLLGVGIVGLMARRRRG